MNIRSMTASLVACVAMSAMSGGVAPGGEQPEGDPSGYFPDSTILHMSVRNLAASKEIFKQTAVGKIWNDTETKAFLAKPLAKLAGITKTFDEGTTFELADLKTALSSRVEIGFAVAPFEGVEVAIIFVAKLPDAETGKRIIRNLPDILKPVMPEGDLNAAMINPDGVSVIGRGPPKLSLAMKGNDLVAVLDDNGSSIGRILGGLGDATLARSKAFSGTMKNLGSRRNFSLYVNTKAVMDLVAEEMQNGPDAQEAAVAMAAMKLLGLLDIKGLGCSITADPPGFTNRLFLHAPEPRKGLLALAKQGKVSDSLLAAIPADVTYFSASKIDIPGIPRLARKVGPLSGADPVMIDDILNQAQAQIGFHPEKDFLHKMGDEVAVVTISGSAVGGIPFMGLNGQAAIVRITDKAAIANSMATMVKLAGGFATQFPLGGGLVSSERDGTVIQGIQLANVIAPSFAVTDEFLIMGAGPQAVAAVLDTIAGKSKAVTSVAEYQAAIKRLGGAKGRSISWARQGELSAPNMAAARIGVMAGLLLPALARAREQARRAQCMSNLKQFGLALNMYAQDHNEKFPDDINALVKEGYITDRALYNCPTGSGGYVYIPGLRTTDPAGIPLMYDAADNHDGDGRNALYIDGHVSWHAEGRFAGELAKAKTHMARSGRAFAPAGGGAPGMIAMPRQSGPFDFLGDAGGNETAMAKALFETVELYKMPSLRSFNRKLFSSAGTCSLTPEGILFTGHGPMPLANVPGGGAGASMSVPGVAIIAAIAIPNLLRSKMAANESAAIAAMRTYCGAQNIFHRTDYDGDGILEYAGPGQMGKTDHNSYVWLNRASVRGAPLELIDNAFARAKLGEAGAAPKAGYYFIDIKKDGQGENYRSPFAYGLCAVPAQYNRTGLNTFIVDVQGTVFLRDNGGKPVTEWPDVNDQDAPWIVCE